MIILSKQTLSFKKNHNLDFPHRFSGFSYVEVLVAMVLIAMALVPAMEALSPATRGSDIHASTTEQYFHLMALVEDLKVKPFSELDAEAVAINDASVVSVVYSDPVNSVNRRLVFLSRYDDDDADNDQNGLTGGDAGLVWIKVEIEGSHRAVEQLISLL